MICPLCLRDTGKVAHLDPHTATPTWRLYCQHCGTHNAWHADPNPAPADTEPATPPPTAEPNARRWHAQAQCPHCKAILDTYWSTSEGLTDITLNNPPPGA